LKGGLVKLSKTFAIIGGDLRSVFLAKLLINDGFTVKVHGLFSDIPECESMELAVREADFVIGPIPFFQNDFLEVTKHTIENLFNAMNDKQVFIAGPVSDDVKELALQNSIKVIDLFDSEEFAILNAIPTAEGAIQIAMGEIPITINGSNIVISGFGRIGKILAKMLSGIGSDICIFARNDEQLAIARSLGYKYANINNIHTVLNDAHVIFNTVPSLVFDRTLIDQMNSPYIIIDVASKPYGVDFNYCESLGIKAIIASGLPGKVAPKTASLFIKETIMKSLLLIGYDVRVE
jgi:dipicolinate synthase subunit A